MKVKDLPLDQINVGTRFREDMGDIHELANSIALKGLIQPITVDQDYNLVAGGRRFHAVKQLGLEKISCIIRQTDDELDLREVELFENLHRKEMTWQEKARITKHIHNLMREIHGENWTQRKTANLLNRSVGSINDSVQLATSLEYLPELAEAPTADHARKKLKRTMEEAEVATALQAAKEKGKSHVVTWANNHYRIGDALEGLERLNDNVYNFAEVDPPYAIDLKNRREPGQNSKTYNEVDADDYPQFIQHVANHTYRALADDTFCVWWFGPTWFTATYKALTQAGFKVDDIPAIWYKEHTGSGLGNPNYSLAHHYEPFFICRKGSPVLRARGRSNVFVFQGVAGSNRIHATERPVPLIQAILQTFTYPGATVLCPFLGSGNTLIAAYHEGCVAFGWDLSEEHKRGFLARVQQQFPDDFKVEEQF